ncbi:MAG: hypothetical protein UT05_C0001G0079 [Parcubacteria group bacterium GW2011_GWF2_38_76]|nr:MAG: hypothetical protein UT05_C0001G0079 [Parcubacteria group bacterium GW2011_GWF2_38_76]HBM45944.1 hypothetical protein [Patescibacteria group bacterium]
MDIILYFLRYVVWHYTRAIKDLFTIWINFIWFTFNFFSIPLLLKTFFSPWKRLGEERKGFFDVTFIIIDTIMRLFGIFLRSITIIIGLVFVILVIALGPVALTLWLVWPLIILYLLTKGLVIFIK